MLLEVFLADENISTKEISNQESVIYFPKPTEQLLDNIPLWQMNFENMILIVDDCSIEFHNQIFKLINPESNKIGLITLDYEKNSVPSPQSYFWIDPLRKEEIIKILLQTHPDLTENTREQIAEFSDGFPVIAYLLADSPLEEGLKGIPDGVIVEMLVEGRKKSGLINGSELWDVLCGISIFKMVGFEHNVKEEIEILSNEIFKTTNYRRILIQQLERGIIQKRGRYIHVSPIPLAIHLAAKWWTENSEEFILKVLNQLNSNLFQALSDQLTNLHYLPEAKRFVEKLTQTKGLFRNENVMNSESGSRIFISFVEINPLSSVECLESIYGNKTKDELIKVKTSRRNIVWSLEKLCWWSDIFIRSAKLMLLFAEAENEDNISNNATGQFLQLYQIFLSGTQAHFEIRLNLFDSILLSGSDFQKNIAVKALGNSLTTLNHSSRTGGVEKQGSRPIGHDWYPKNHNELIEILNQVINRLKSLLLNEDELGKISRMSLIQSVRDLVNAGLLDEIEIFTKNLLNKFPDLRLDIREKLINAYKYDAEKYPLPYKNKLANFIKELHPNTFVEQLNEYVIKPPWFFDNEIKEFDAKTPEERAEKFAIKYASNEENIVKNIHLFFQLECRQCFVFGKMLAKKIMKIEYIVERCLAYLKSSTDKFIDVRFLGGFLEGLRKENSKYVEDILEKVSKDNKLIKWIVDLTRLSNPTFTSVIRLIDLLKIKKIQTKELSSFSFGAVLRNLEPDELAKFGNELRKIDIIGAQISLHLLMQYKDVNEVKSKNIDGVIKNCILTPKFITKSGDDLVDHHWEAAVKYFVITDKSIIKPILKQILDHLGSKDIFKSTWEHACHRVLLFLLDKHLAIVWHILKETLLKEKDNKLIYGLKTYKFERSGGMDSISIIAEKIPENELIKWCEESPEKAPYILSETVPVLKNNKLNPLILYILKNFGHIPNIKGIITSRLYSFSSVGSIVPYYQQRYNALKPHEKDTVLIIREWINEQLKYLEKLIESENIKDEERELGIY
ncbi:hypothetical protein ACFLSX_02850 [Calditrichota bacterium]